MPPQMGSSFAQGQGGILQPIRRLLQCFGQLLQSTSFPAANYDQHCNGPFERRNPIPRRNASPLRRKGVRQYS